MMDVCIYLYTMLLKAKISINEKGVSCRKTGISRKLLVVYSYPK